MTTLRKLQGTFGWYGSREGFFVRVAILRGTAVRMHMGDMCACGSSSRLAFRCGVG